MTLQETNTHKDHQDSISVHSNPGPSMASNSSGVGGAMSEKMDITLGATSDESPAPSAHMLVYGCMS